MDFCARVCALQSSSYFRVISHLSQQCTAMLSFYASTIQAQHSVMTSAILCTCTSIMQWIPPITVSAGCTTSHFLSEKLHNSQMSMPMITDKQSTD